MAVVRPARPADVSRVAAIERAVFTDPWSAASFGELLGDPQVIFTVAEADAEVVGYSVVWTVMDEAELANVAVAPGAQRAGLGGLLVDQALAAARRRGAAVMFLEVRESNVAARSLYASRGFEQVGRRRRYYRRPVEDALVLRAPLSSARRGGDE